MPATEELRVHIRTVADTTGARQTQQALTGVQRQAAQTGRAVAGASAGVGAGFNQSSRSILEFAGALGIASTASAAFAQGAHALVDVVSSSLQVQRDNERVLRATAAAYGQQAQLFERFATKLSAATGFSSQAILEAALSARTLSANYGLTVTQTQRLIQVSADLARIRGIGVAEAFERVQSAIRGEAEASEYLGLTLNDTFIKNNAMNGSLKSTFETMTDGEKAQVRYNELLRQTDQFQGLASRSASSLDASISKTEVSINRLQLALGKAIAPAATVGFQGLAGAADLLATQTNKVLGVFLALNPATLPLVGTFAALQKVWEAFRNLPEITLPVIGTVGGQADRERAITRAEREQARLLALNTQPLPPLRTLTEQLPASGASVTERAAGARREERRLPEQRRELDALQQIGAAERELMNLREGGRLIQQAQSQLSIREAQVTLSAVAQRRGIERELSQIDEQQAQRAREAAQLDRDQAQRARELASLEREINSVYDQRLRLQQESARIGAELASLPAQFALEDAQERLQRARLVASDRGRSAGERSSARRTIRAEERGLPSREIAALDATAALRALDRQQRISGLEGRAAQIPLEERRIDMQEQIRVTQEIVDAIKEQQQLADIRDEERRNYLQAQLQSSQDIVDALHDQSAQLALVAQVNTAAIESQQDRLDAVITAVVTQALQAQGKLPTPVDLTVRVATDNQDPAVVYQQLIEANGQAVIPPVVQLSGVRR